MYNSFMYVIDNEGIDIDSAYPYQASVSGPLHSMQVAVLSPLCSHCIVLVTDWFVCTLYTYLDPLLHAANGITPH